MQRPVYTVLDGTARTTEIPESDRRQTEKNTKEGLMKGLIVTLLALTWIGAATTTAKAAKPSEFTFTVVSNEGGRSNAVGSVRLQSVGNGKTQVHVAVKGLQAGGTYTLTWSGSTDCTTGAQSIDQFTVKGNGVLNVTKLVGADSASIGSIGLTSSGTLVACAATHP